jgi:hypothetical protein
MAAPNVPPILMLILHALAVAANTKLYNWPEIWLSFGIYPSLGGFN